MTGVQTCALPISTQRRSGARVHGTVVAMPDQVSSMASALHGVRTPRNLRTGRTKGYRAQKGGAHQVAWQEDPIVLDRIRAGLKPWLERRSPLECLDVIRAYMAEAHPGEPEVSLRTMYEDRERAQSLTTRDLEALRAEHVAELDHVIRRGYEALELTNPNGSGRAALLGMISQAIERKAKVDGTLATALQIASIAVVESPKAEERVEVECRMRQWRASWRSRWT